MSAIVSKNSPAMGRMLRNLTHLASGTIVAQIVLALSMPLLTRLFAPDAFAIASLFSAAYAFLIPIVTLKYDQAIVLPKAHTSAQALGHMVMRIAAVNSIAVGVGVVAWMYFFHEWRKASFLLLPLALWLGAAYTLMQQWSSRASNYTHYARSQVVGAVLNVAICAGFAWLWSAEPIFLVLGFTAGTGMSLAYTIRGFKGWPYRGSTAQARGIARQVKVYGHFPLLVLPTALVTIIGANGIPFVLASQYSLTEVGFFAMAQRVLLIPGAVVGGALAEAVRAEFAARQRTRERVTPTFKRALTWILGLAGAFFGTIYLVAPVAFGWVFGLQYAESGGIAQALILAAFSHFACAPFMYVFAILRRPAMGLLGQVLIALLPMGVLILSSLWFVPLIDALQMYSLCTLGGAAIMLTLVYRGCVTFDARQGQQA
jgi:O-antigen/teichoic acid export membrane protein